MTEQSEAEQCRVVWSVALEKAVGECGEAEAARQLARVLGLETPASGEPDIDCQAALSEGLNAETMDSFRGRNQWVFCRAWNMVREEDMELRRALDKAWAEVRQAEEEQEDSMDDALDELLQG